MKTEDTLFTRDFLILNAILFLTYSNIAVFFQFPFYLEHRLGIAPQWIGLLIGVFAFTGLVVRPFASAWIHPANARRAIFWSAAGVVLSLVLYHGASTVGSISVVRIVHGFTYVIFGTAVMTEIVVCVPPRRSGQAFGLIAVITLLPYAVMPPLLKPLSAKLGGFVTVLLWLGLVMALVLPLSSLLGRAPTGDGERQRARISWQDFVANARDLNMILLFLVSLFLFTAFAATFFYLKGYGLEKGLSNPGWFFTLSTGMEIGVRVLFSSYFDRIDKVRALGLSMALLGVVFLVLAVTRSHALFLVLAVVFGLCMGVAMPLLNSLIFDCSEPRFRPLNTNLSLEMFQGGFFLGSLLGGLVLARWGYTTIFHACGALCLGSVGLIGWLYHHKKGTKTA